MTTNAIIPFRIMIQSCYSNVSLSGANYIMVITKVSTRPIQRACRRVNFNDIFSRRAKIERCYHRGNTE